MGYLVATKNSMLNKILTDHPTIYLSLHAGNPGETGLNEISGGDPAYIRKLASFAAAVDGEVIDSTVHEFDVPGGGTTVTHVGCWDAESGGNFIVGSSIQIEEGFGAQGIYTLTNFTLGI